MDASRMTIERSWSSSRFHVASASRTDALAVPLRHGVHCPHDSYSKKRIRLRAAPAAVSWSERTMTAAEPMKQP